jgi:hypothetical protein
MSAIVYNRNRVVNGVGMRHLSVGCELAGKHRIVEALQSKTETWLFSKHGAARLRRFECPL